MSHEKYETLLMKVVDGFATDDESRELNRHAEECANCREELASFTKIKETTDAMTARILQSARIDPPRPSPLARMAENSGFFLLLGAFTILSGYAVFEFWNDPEIAPLIKYTISAVG